MECFSVPEPDDWSSPKPTPSRAPERAPHHCLGCGWEVSPDNPFTLCDDCWDKTYPPKATFAFDFAKPPPAASVRADEIVVRREDLGLVLDLADADAVWTAEEDEAFSRVQSALVAYDAALTAAQEPSGKDDGQ